MFFYKSSFIVSFILIVPDLQYFVLKLEVLTVCIWLFCDTSFIVTCLVLKVVCLQVGLTFLY